MAEVDLMKLNVDVFEISIGEVTNLVEEVETIFSNNFIFFLQLLAYLLSVVLLWKRIAFAENGDKASSIQRLLENVKESIGELVQNQL